MYSKNVETAEQFMLMYARYVCDFSGFSNFPRDLKKKVFSIPFTDRGLGLKADLCLYQKLIIAQFMQISCFLDGVCLLFNWLPIMLRTVAFVRRADFFQSWPLRVISLESH